MLSPSDLRRMRDTVEATVLPGTAVIHAFAGTSDGMGGWTEAFTASGTVDARLDYLSGDEADIASRLTDRAEMVLTTASTVTIPPDARIVFAGGTYEVTAVLPVDPWKLCNRAFVARHT